MTDYQYSKYTKPNYTEKNMPSTRMTSRRAKNIENNLIKQIVVVGALTVAIAAAFILIVIPRVITFLSKGTSSMNSVQNTGVPPQMPIIAAPVAATNSATINISGFSQKGNQIVVLSNGQEAKRIDASEDGSFSSPVELQIGDNSLTFFAINTSTQQESATTQPNLVKYDKEPPKLDISDPQDNATMNGSRNKRLSIEGTTDTNTRVSLNDGVVFVKY